MPKVKFSTLVSAMAGKSQGSVFSKNQGGSYFRNNKSGYGTKTVAQQSNQAKFKSVGRRWSGLSDLERDSWNAATVNFPTKNIFGDSRQPSGYELFCRVNGARLSRGMSIALVPVIPQEVPGIDSLSWNTPDGFLFQENKGLLLNQVTTSFSSVAFRSQSEDSNLLLNTFAVSFSILFDSVKNINSLLTPGFELKIQSGDELGPCVVTFESGVPGFIKCRVMGFQLSEEANGYSVFDIPLNYFREDNVFLIANKPVQRFEFVLSINGIPLIASESVYSNDFSNLEFKQVEFNSGVPGVVNGYQIRDIRVYQSSFDVPPVNQLLAGYVSGFEAWIVQLEHSGNSFGKVFSSLGDWTGFELLNGSPNQILISAYSLRVPMVELDLSGSVANNFEIDVVTTRPVSSGVGLKSSDFLKVGTVEYSDVTSIDISQMLKQKFGYFTEGNDFNIAVRLYDVLSGVVYNPAPAVKPAKKPRFKAGTDLQGSISKK